MNFTIIYGAVTTGKTTRLLNKLKVEQDTGAKTILINHTLDTRSDGAISTHNNQINWKNDGIYKIKADSLTDVANIIHDYDVIGIDEAQFFDDIAIVLDWITKENKIVFISSLNYKADLTPFGLVHTLIPFCSSYGGKVEFMEGRCDFCLKEGKPRLQSVGTVSYMKQGTLPENGISIGGVEKYGACCWNHHPKNNQ
jgi:thymidine kinase